MAQVSEGARHALATAAAVLGFLLAYLGLSLNLWAALALALGLYAALLLLIRARPETGLALPPLSPEADLREAHAHLREAAARLRRRAPEAARPEDRALVETLAARVEELDRILSDEPSHLRLLRRFAGVFLPRMAETVEAWLKLSRASDPALAPRIAALRAQLAGYPEAVGALIRAALNQDLIALEAEVEALSSQIRR